MFYVFYLIYQTFQVSAARTCSVVVCVRRQRRSFTGNAGRHLTLQDIELNGL